MTSTVSSCDVGRARRRCARRCRAAPARCRARARRSRPPRAPAARSKRRRRCRRPRRRRPPCACSSAASKPSVTKWNVVPPSISIGSCAWWVRTKTGAWYGGSSPHQPRQSPVPLAADRAEHVAPHDVGARGRSSSSRASRRRRPGLVGVEVPLVQLHAADAERVVTALIGAGDEAVERDGHVAGDSGHAGWRTYTFTRGARWGARNERKLSDRARVRAVRTAERSSGRGRRRPERRRCVAPRAGQAADSEPGAATGPALLVEAGDLFRPAFGCDVGWAHQHDRIPQRASASRTPTLEAPAFPGPRAGQILAT